MNKSEIERQTIKRLVNKLETRIKEVQQEAKQAYSQEDVWIKNGIERELIYWKIYLEKWRKRQKTETL